MTKYRITYQEGTDDSEHTEDLYEDEAIKRLQTLLEADFEDDIDALIDLAESYNDWAYNDEDLRIRVEIL